MARVIVLQADVEGSFDLILQEAKQSKDEDGRIRVKRGDHARFLTIPGLRGDRRLVIDKTNAKEMGVGSTLEFFTLLTTHPGPARGDFTYTLVLPDFKYQEIETMTYQEILDEIKERTGIEPVRRSLTKGFATLALRRLRRLAEQDRAPKVTPVIPEPTTPSTALPTPVLGNSPAPDKITPGV